jgi:hypothetical protein
MKVLATGVTPPSEHLQRSIDSEKAAGSSDGFVTRTWTNHVEACVKAFASISYVEGMAKHHMQWR